MLISARAELYGKNVAKQFSARLLRIRRSNGQKLADTQSSPEFASLPDIHNSYSGTRETQFTGKLQDCGKTSSTGIDRTPKLLIVTIISANGSIVV